jgi:hypothetical protein
MPSPFLSPLSFFFPPNFSKHLASPHFLFLLFCFVLLSIFYLSVSLSLFSTNLFKFLYIISIFVTVLFYNKIYTILNLLFRICFLFLCLFLLLSFDLSSKQLKINFYSNSYLLLQPNHFPIPSTKLR